MKGNVLTGKSVVLCIEPVGVRTHPALCVLRRRADKKGVLIKTEWLNKFAMPHSDNASCVLKENYSQQRQHRYQNKNIRINIKK